jgi:type IV secretion system protein VirB6
MINMRGHLRKILMILGLVISFVITETEEVHAGFNSLAERETQVNFSGFFDFLMKLVENVYNCNISSILVVTSQLDNTCIPRIITSDSSYEKDCENSKDNGYASNLTLLGVAGYIVSLLFVIGMGFIPFIGTGLFLIGIVALSSVIITCLSTYILAPHEYINGLLGQFKCKERGSKVVNVAEGALTMDDVPFFYNCANTEVEKEKLAYEVKSGDLSGLDALTGYGNMAGGSTPYCMGMNADYALNNLKNPKNGMEVKKSFGGIDLADVEVGSVILGYVGGKNILDRIVALFEKRDLCDVDDDDLKLFNMKDIRKGGWEFSIDSSGSAGKPIPFYRLYGGKIQLCIVNVTIFLGGIISGCTYVAPPIEAVPIDAGFTAGTRCSYFLSSRSDLISLGNNINSTVHHHKYEPVGLFLQSDFHIMSTIVGCIQDLLIKVVVGGTDDLEQSLLFQIQEALKDIVRIVLVLYISLLGVKIISNPNPPQTSEVVMYVLKFAGVIAMSGVGGPNIWYNKDSDDGMYKLLLDSMDDLSNKVLQSTNNLAPVNMCYYEWDDGENVLSLRDIDATPGNVGSDVLRPTVAMLNKDKLKVTVWDFIDCKLASYLSLNSCKYTMSGMVSMWLISACIFLPTIFLLGITTIIFCIMLFITMLRFSHLSIVSMFSLTILVLVSPIISCFMLFDYTKETFKTWFKMLIGYTIYPAMIFSFIALMTATFDSIFYGQIPSKNKACLESKNCTFEDICGNSKSDNNSIYCTITRAVKDAKDLDDDFRPNMCELKTSEIFDSITESYDIKAAGLTWYSITALKDSMFEDIFIGIGKMLLFTILFYNMTNSIISFFETLLQVYGIGSLAPTYSAVGRKMFQGVGFALKSQGWALKKVGTGAAKKAWRAFK